MSDQQTRKFSWTLVLPLAMLFVHALVVRSVQRGEGFNGNPFGLVVLAEVVPYDLIVRLAPTPIERRLACGWTQCLNGDMRPKPLMITIFIAGAGCILMGLALGVGLDLLFSGASSSLVSLKSATKSGTLSFILLMLGTIVFEALRPTEKIIAIRSPQSPIKVAINSGSQRAYLIGLEYFKDGNHQKAEEKWRLALELDGNNLDAKRGLDRLSAINSPAPADNRDCIQSNGNPPPSYLPGVIHFQKQDYAGARTLWEKALVEKPKDCDTLAGLSRIKKLYGEDN